jgi:hypothetical protein
MGKESGTWTRFRDGLRGRGRFRRMENALERGTPDCSFVVPLPGTVAAEGWVEFKQGQPPKRETTAVFKSQHGLSPEQIDWIAEHVALGGRAWIFAQVGQRLYLVHGSWCREFNGMTVGDLESTAAWRGGPRVSAEEWELLAAVLVSWPPIGEKGMARAE